MPTLVVSSYLTTDDPAHSMGNRNPARRSPVAKAVLHHLREEHAADGDYASKWGDVIVVVGEM